MNDWIRTLTAGAIILLAIFLSWYVVSIFLVHHLDGTGGVHAPGQNFLQHSSEDGVSFSYPNTYNLSSKTNTAGGQTYDLLLLVDKNYTAAQNGETPPAISMTVFTVPVNTTLESWVKNDPRSTYKLSTDKALTPGTVGGEPSLSYHYSGLYENDATAVLHNSKVFVLEAGWMDQNAQIRSDYTGVLNSVQFQ